MTNLQRKSGRIEINLTALKMGRDVCIILTGGEAHLGAVTVGSKDVNDTALKTIAVKNHKEDVLTQELGEILKREYPGNFVICCGIHIDNITKEEIGVVIDLSRQLIREFSQGTIQ